jgi:hypothetical protein
MGKIADICSPRATRRPKIRNEEQLPVYDRPATARRAVTMGKIADICRPAALDEAL